MQEKDPSFPMYAKDWLMETKRLPFDVKGVHADLRAEAWMNGAFDNEDGYPVGLTAVERKLFDGCKHLWKLENGKWSYPPDEEAREKRKIFRSNQKIKAQKSVESRKNEHFKGFNKINSVKKTDEPDINHGSEPVDSVSLTTVEPKKEIANGNAKGNKKGKGTGKGKTLFRDSPHFDFSVFQFAFRGSQWEGKEVNLQHYYDAALDWSNSKGEVMADWIAAVQSWMRRDESKGILITKNYKPKANGSQQPVSEIGKTIVFDKA